MVGLISQMKMTLTFDLDS